MEQERHGRYHKAHHVLQLVIDGHRQLAEHSDLIRSDGCGVVTK